MDSKQYLARLTKKFWSLVEKRGKCWMWKGRTDDEGYGLIYAFGNWRRAHRISWLIDKGEKPPDDRNVCHECDTPGCIRPSHLFLGTQLENLKDRQEKGHHRGWKWKSSDNHHLKILSNEDRAEIRALMSKGIRGTGKKLAAIFHCSLHTIYGVSREQ